ncbi:MAG: PD-(D/E)XK nuclease family protein [Flavobacteriaceae bacterium]|nr:PD-(D/E)XK nuclease family protein [Flavobacteriaceae bacterium]
MATFIHNVLLELKKKEVDISMLTFILPSKRAGVFLKQELSNINSQTIFSPYILSIEEFVEELSQLKQISNLELLFEFYEVYGENMSKEKLDSFDVFSKWAQILLHDFNEIDRYLIPQEQIFNYLNAIQELNHWSLENNQTSLIKNYLSFWEKLNTTYINFTNHLINKGLGYQGLIYREAVENLENYIQANQNKKNIFIGFNALNTAESTIIQELLQNNLAEIYWDVDETFVNSSNHTAGFFLRNYKTNWKYYKSHPFNWISKNYKKEKNISIVGIPKNVGQAKYIGELLLKLKQENNTLNRTAVVLGDEKLLIPVLNSIPKNIDALNITMGFPLNMVPLASLFEQLFILHRDKKRSFYHKDVIALLSNQFINPLFKISDENLAKKIIDSIKTNNLIFITKEKLINLAKEKDDIITLLFKNWEGDPKTALQNCLSLIFLIKESLNQNKKENLLGLEYLYRFNKMFNVLNELNIKHKYINTIKTLHSLYKEILKSETLDFQGEPLQGLQIMGMLESRVLDFETVIISSVNEGVLPSGKSSNSFIPFDVKTENGLPTYKEKDAVYTYHFYRLLQRAKNIFILYNTEPDILNGGEKSRFITQLEIEDIHNLKQLIVTPKTPVINKQIIKISKTEDILTKIKAIALKGFSPSSLTNYIRNPIDFYYQKILEIKELDDVEETVAANTLGSVVHNTLEDFYKPIVGKFLSVELIKKMKINITKTVTHHFNKVYKEGDITKGKNLIIFEIAKRYVSNFLDLEIKYLKQGNQIKIVAIEDNNTVLINIPELSFPVNLTGKVDRVDEYNGVTRIIDYKTGKVEQGKVEIVNWEDITTDYTKYSKSFQVLTYAYMMHKKNPFNRPVEAGIVSFKNLKGGFLKFSKKDKAGAYAKKESLITKDTLDNFYNELKTLILEICNPNIPFTEKEL